MFASLSDTGIENLCSDLNDICANLELSAFLHFENVCSFVLVRSLQRLLAVGMLPRSWLHICILLPILGVPGILLFSCTIKQARALFLERKIESFKWNFILPNSFCTVQSLVYRCFVDRLWEFYSRFYFNWAQKIGPQKSPKGLHLGESLLQLNFLLNRFTII